MENNNFFVKSILKTLLVLEQFINDNEKGIKELSVSTGLPASTVQRIVNTLELKNYLMQNPKNNKYRLGFALYNISKAYVENLDWIEEARTYMEKMVQKHKETVNLAILQGQKIVHLTKVDSPHMLRPNFIVGTHFPFFCTALGKCIIAFQPSEISDKLIPSRLEAYTANTITAPEKLRAELNKIRTVGYAIDNEEFQVGLICIATPIRDFKGRVVAAISITIPKPRLVTEKIPEIVHDMIETANNISAKLSNS